MMFRTDYINKALIDQEGHLRLPHNKQEALRHLFADAPPISGQRIEVGDFDPSISLPKLKDLTRAN